MSRDFQRSLTSVCGAMMRLRNRHKPFRKSVVVFLFTPQSLSEQLEETEGELAAEKKNSLKRDKTIQGLSILLKEKERQVATLFLQIRT